MCESPLFNTLHRCSGAQTLLLYWLALIIFSRSFLDQHLITSRTVFDKTAALTYWLIVFCFFILFFLLSLLLFCHYLPKYSSRRLWRKCTLWKQNLVFFLLLFGQQTHDKNHHSDRGGRVWSGTLISKHCPLLLLRAYCSSKTPERPWNVHALIQFCSLQSRWWSFSGSSQTLSSLDVW